MSEEKLALLTAEIEWYREKVDATADAMEALGKKTIANGSFNSGWTLVEASKLVRRINDKSLLDDEVER